MNIDIRNLQKWLNEEQEAPIDRQALARVLAMAEQPAQRPWVGLTPEEEQAAVYDENGCVVDYEDYAFAIEANSRRRTIGKEKNK